MRLIDADALENQFGISDADLLALDEIRYAPIVDAEVVVRCKDCKYYRESRVLAPNKFCFRLNHPTEPGKIGYNFADDDFCSRGVRKDEANAEG